MVGAPTRSMARANDSYRRTLPCSQHARGSSDSRGAWQSRRAFSIDVPYRPEPKLPFDIRHEPDLDDRQGRRPSHREAPPLVECSNPCLHGGRSPPPRGQPPCAQGFDLAAEGARSPPQRAPIPCATGSPPVAGEIRTRCALDRTAVSHSLARYLIRDFLRAAPPSNDPENFVLRSRITLTCAASVCPERRRAPLLSRFASRHLSCRRASTEPLPSLATTRRSRRERRRTERHGESRG